MTSTEIIAQATDRFEQHQADLALIECPRAYLTRIGVTEQAISEAEARIAAFKAL